LTGSRNGGRGWPGEDLSGSLRGRAASALKARAAMIVAGGAAGRLIGPATGYRVRHHGLAFDVHGADFSPRVRAQMFWGAYESAETRMIRGLLRGSTTVVELGSSLGVTTAHIAAAMAAGGHLVCVEANPRLVPGLRSRIKRSAPAVQVEVIHAAVAGYSGTAALTLARQTVGSRLWRAHPGRPGPGSGRQTVTVPALTLRDLLIRTGIGEFDLVSDIEGAETSFLLADPGVLDRCGRAVLELHDTVADGGREVTVADLLDAAIAAGFRVLCRHGPVVALGRG
jgi:FkbM family methyltransferase